MAMQANFNLSVLGLQAQVNSMVSNFNDSQPQVVKTEIESVRKRLTACTSNCTVPTTQTKLSDLDTTLTRIQADVQSLQTQVQNIFQDTFALNDDVPAEPVGMSEPEPEQEVHDAEIQERAATLLEDTPCSVVMILEAFQRMQSGALGESLRKELESLSGSVLHKSKILTLLLLESIHDRTHLPELFDKANIIDRIGTDIPLNFEQIAGIYEKAILSSPSTPDEETVIVKINQIIALSDEWDNDDFNAFMTHHLQPFLEKNPEEQTEFFIQIIQDQMDEGMMDIARQMARCFKDVETRDQALKIIIEEYVEDDSTPEERTQPQYNAVKEADLMNAGALWGQMHDQEMKDELGLKLMCQWFSIGRNHQAEVWLKAIVNEETLDSAKQELVICYTCIHAFSDALRIAESIGNDAERESSIQYVEAEMQDYQDFLESDDTVTP